MSIAVRQLGLCDYQQTWDAMRTFVERADDNTGEEIWLLQHPPVYTLGKNGKPEHLLRASDIPLIQCDRGGQITYHAPGQLVIYLLLNIKQRRLGLRRLVMLIEHAVIDFLAQHNISARGDRNAPGVYTDKGKIAALGLRLRHGWCYHGISINIDMDLSPFANINPCGYENLPVTHIAAYTPPPTVEDSAEQFSRCLLYRLQHADAL